MTNTNFIIYSNSVEFLTFPPRNFYANFPAGLFSCKRARSIAFSRERAGNVPLSCERAGSVCALQIKQTFPPIYIQHNQCPCPCLLERRALPSQTSAQGSVLRTTRTQKHKTTVSSLVSNRSSPKNAGPFLALEIYHSARKFKDRSVFKDRLVFKIVTKRYLHFRTGSNKTRTTSAMPEVQLEGGGEGGKGNGGGSCR